MPTLGTKKLLFPKSTIFNKYDLGAKYSKQDHDISLNLSTHAIWESSNCQRYTLNVVERISFLCEVLVCQFILQITHSSTFSFAFYRSPIVSFNKHSFLILCPSQLRFLFVISFTSCQDLTCIPPPVTGLAPACKGGIECHARHGLM